MKLTLFAKILIAIVLGLAVAGIGYFFFGKKGTDSNTTTEQTTTDGKTEVSDNQNQETQTTDNATDKGTTNERATFDYTPPKPQNGVLKGVVEVGASGFNSFIINVDKQKNWELKKADFGKSMMYEKMTTPLEIKEGLKNYIGAMTDYGVLPHNIHFVVSSGAQQSDICQKMITYIKERGFVVNTVTAEQEGQLALKCALPPMYKSSAFVTDIGSGNTKISWFTGENVKAIESYGAKYFQKSITNDQAYSDVKAKAKQVPVDLRKTCFIIGGVPFELAKQGRKDNERYTVLNAPESYKAEGEKQVSGINLYKGIADATGCKTFVFDWDANFTIGFLLSL